MTIIFISLGVTLCLFGLIGLCIVIYSGFLVRKNSGRYSAEVQKTILERLIIINYLALSLGAFGLIIILIGILFR